MDELPIIAAALERHQLLDLAYECECGRVPVRGHCAHQAEEIQLALHNEGMGVFMFERLGLLEDEIP